MSDRSKPPRSPADLLAVALEAARAGAAVVRDAAPTVRSVTWQTKQHADFVSEVDLAAERAVLGVVARLAPEAGVLAEESASGVAAPSAPASGDVFVVDPLDGTTNFLHGYPEYAVSVGVVRDGVPIAGVVATSPSTKRSPPPRAAARSSMARPSGCLPSRIPRGRSSAPGFRSRVRTTSPRMSENSAP